MGHELQKRIFRCRGRKVDYPVPRSGATRFHGPDCAGATGGLPASGHGQASCPWHPRPEWTRRLKRHEADIEKLETQSY